MYKMSLRLIELGLCSRLYGDSLDTRARQAPVSFHQKVIHSYDGDKAGLEATAKAFGCLAGSGVGDVHPDQMDRWCLKRPPRSLASSWQNSQVNGLNSWCTTGNPSILKNLQAVEFVEEANRWSLNALYHSAALLIYKLALFWLWLLQIEQIVNSSRLHQRQEDQVVDDQERRIFSRSPA